MGDRRGEERRGEGERRRGEEWRGRGQEERREREEGGREEGGGEAGGREGVKVVWGFVSGFNVKIGYRRAIVPRAFDLGDSVP